MGYGAVEIHFTSLGGMKYKIVCSLNDGRNHIRINHFQRFTVATYVFGHLKPHMQCMNVIGGKINKEEIEISSKLNSFLPTSSDGTRGDTQKILTNVNILNVHVCVNEVKAY